MKLFFGGKVEKYEVGTIDKTSFEMDVINLIAEESIMFNATAMAKKFDKEPYEWLRKQVTKDCIEAIESTTELLRSELVVTKSKSGSHNGTWLHNELAIPFASWLNPTFGVKLNQYTKRKIAEDIYKYQAREAARYGYFPLVRAIEESRKLLGKETKEYHKINEFRMVAKLATGYYPSEYIKKYKVQTFRDHLAPYKIKLLEYLQQANTNLINMSLDYHTRKGMLTTLKDNIKRGIVSID